jgi:two-component system, NarL family, nitrate/nitrite response regulator NarL
MSMRSVIAAHPDKPSIAIIDSRKLRQAGIMYLLAAWADAMGLTVTAVSSDMPLEKHINGSCEMVILSVGSASVEDPQQQGLIRNVRERAPRAALVVISDRDESKEVCAAFERGAAGFMSTSIEPSVALPALSFIKSGGTFFPPSALSYAYSRSEMPSVREQIVNGSDRYNHLSDEVRDFPSKLSAKQEEVFKLLRQGPSNKVIARHLGVSEATVKVHIRCIMRKFGVANRTQLAIAAMNDGALPIEARRNEIEESQRLAQMAPG